MAIHHVLHASLRRCTKDCTFSPYFPSHEPQKFAIVHKVFDASNVRKMLQVPLALFSVSFNFFDE